MRFFYALAAVAVFFIDSEVSPVEAETSLIKLKPLKGAQVVTTPNTNKRFLRQYAEFEDEDSEERIKTGTVVLDTTKKIDDFFGIETINKVLDPKQIDEVLKGKKLFGWLDTKTFDDALNGDLMQKREIFAFWRANRLKPRTLTSFMNLHPALEKKYRFVYEAYEGYIKMVAAKKLSGMKRARETN
ncbi:hypothetical protein F441_12904 [Phytophthora nicotianae CJ01A1]|uniref:RxLR effector protein n=2 Tax=Phytophthora nicotianae TaxID=4792 RepID=W2WM51_PHYNI|nr:hypothetical protein L915_12643 [Phytophthora nicotianae]ETP11586.1 hypothetical protein F441_12904 [Phytophthora nicotianae CJ01A1]